MPLFEYKCGKCGAKFEKLVFGAAPDRLVCPKCGAEEATRQLSTFATGGGSCSTSASSGFS